jgi:hypothetical protein
MIITMFRISWTAWQRCETEKRGKFRESPETDISGPSDALPSDEKSMIGVTEEIHRGFLGRMSPLRGSFLICGWDIGL